MNKIEKLCIDYPRLIKVSQEDEIVRGWIQEYLKMDKFELKDLLVDIIVDLVRSRRVLIEEAGKETKKPTIIHYHSNRDPEKNQE